MGEELDNEGIVLALGAVAEVLNKQNAVLEKMIRKQEEEEEAEEEKKVEEMKKAEQNELIKAVVAELKKTLSISDTHDAPPATSSGADSEEGDKNIKPRLEPGTQEHQKQQEVIQAAEDDDEDEDKIAESKKMKKEDDEGEKEDEKEYPEVEKLKKQITELTKALADSKGGVDEKLRKMGWREETGLVGPKRVELGANEPVLKKGMEEEDRVAQLAKLDYATLKKMEIEAESGSLPEGIQQLLR